MTSLVFMFLLHIASVCWSAGQSRAVYGLPDLTRDILEKIKAATGQPIDTNRFMPILFHDHPSVAASAKNYEVVEHQPFTKTSQFLKKTKKNNLDKGSYSLSENNKNSNQEKDHFFELFEHEKDGNELLKHKYGDHVGKSHKFNEEQYFSKNHHKSGGGQKGGKFKKGRKRGKFHVEKGFRDIYHKDEEKKSDIFWNNQHEEGKWIEYGFKKRKQEKSQDKDDEGKKEKDKTEESSYEKKENKCTKCKS